ncbi:hypothetical protein EW026_g2103 [Hermanssonia centrifuga]|uniref:Uncharacterized protein n=1 Tax=Hermanssonia centrifuga TaxID=98765 RepID=A0A4S4KPC4_9APHY|nr:hypothetical protein EW026_g2103 [Hermanssonia centrifuga]
MTKRKRGGFSTSTYAQVTLLNGIGTAKVTRPTLGTLRSDRIATEKQHAQQVLGDRNNAIHRALTESALQIGADPSTVSADYEAFRPSDGHEQGFGGYEQDNDDNFEDVEDGALNCLIDRPALRRHKDYRTRLQSNRALWHSWEAEIPTLAQCFLQWKHSIPAPAASDDVVHLFDVAVVGTFVLKQWHEFFVHSIILKPARMHGMDGNNSVKRMIDSGHADERVFTSPLFISPEEVNVFKDDVKDKPGKATAKKKRKDQAVIEPPEGDSSSCAERWNASKASAAADETVHTFEQTGIFLSACRHGIVETVAEMRRSGELAKYALATVNRLVDELGDDQTVGHDIACAFTATLRNSSIADKVKRHRLTMSVNAFHGHAHNRMCQLANHPLYRIVLGLEDLETCERVFSASNAVARTVRFSSHFHWCQFLDLHFKQWNEDRYLDLSKFLFNNYRQALKILADFTPQLAAYKRMYGIVDADIEGWPQDELRYLKNTHVEPEKDAVPVAYVEALQSLKRITSEYDLLSGLQFAATPEDVHSIVAKRTGVRKRLLMAMTAVEDLEALLHIAIEDRWAENSKEYKEVLVYINRRQFIRTVCELEGLVVQRLFELSKANLAGTGYKMRQHISKALVRRSAAIRSALERYNKLAVKQQPPRPRLEYSDIATYCLLGEFELLKDSRYGVLTQPWTTPANREITTKHFKTLCARAEIKRLNVEIARVQEWVDREDVHIRTVAGLLATSNPILASEMRQQYARQYRINNVHRARLKAIYKLSGYTGGSPPSLGTNDAQSNDDQVVEQDLDVGGSGLIDEDDALNDEGNRLDEAMDRLSVMS